MMCQLCDQFETIDFNLADFPASIRLDEEDPQYLLLRIEQLNDIRGALTKPIKINYCFICGKSLKDY